MPAPVRQLSSLDVQFLVDSDRNYGHVGGLAALDPRTAGGRLTIDRVRALLLERIHLVPPLTQRLQRVPLDLDWPYWVPDERFDITYHCRELALPKPGSMEQLAEQVARIYSHRLDQSRPLWELYLIHGLRKGRVASRPASAAETTMEPEVISTPAHVVETALPIEPAPVALAPAISAAASGPATPTPRVEGRSRDRCVGECDDRWGIGEVWRRTPPPGK